MRTATHGKSLDNTARRAAAAKHRWDELRTELHERTRDTDLIELWGELSAAERRVILASARLPDTASLLPLEQQTIEVRDIIRASILRMSGYGQRLRDRMDAHRTTSAANLAARARQEIIHGDTDAALYWLGQIEKGAA